MFASYCVLVFQHLLTWCLFLLLLYSSHANHCTNMGDNTDDLGLIFPHFVFFGRKMETAISTFYFLAADSAFRLSSASCWTEISVPRAQLEAISCSIPVFLLKSTFTSTLSFSLICILKTHKSPKTLPGRNSSLTHDTRHWHRLQNLYERFLNDKWTIRR